MSTNSTLARLIKTGHHNRTKSLRRLLLLAAEPKSSHHALSIFQLMPYPRTFDWNILIRAHAHFSPSTSISLFSTMRLNGVIPDHFTLPFVLKACASLRIEKGLHSLVLKLGFCNDTFVQNAMISFYGSCGSVDRALKVFDESPAKDLVSWSSMIASYVNNAFEYEALALFQKMQLTDSIKPDEIMLITLLSAIRSLGDLELGKWVHKFIERKAFELSVRLGTALIEMYSRCASIDDSIKVFDEMPVRNIFTWSALINGLAVHGRTRKAVELFYKMKENGFQPDFVTFNGVLVACSHGGLIEEGFRVFNSIKNEYNMEPKLEQYGCMVDLLGRAGLLYEAFELVNRMPADPSPIIWRTLLGACVNHKNLLLAEKVGEKLQEVDPSHDGDYVLLSNVYGGKDKWVEKERVLNLMGENRISKRPGYSLITMGSVVEKFIAGDDSHPQSEEIKTFLASLIERLRVVGYSPVKSIVLFDVEEEEKEHNLMYHSEKMAVAFALLKFKDNRTIRVMKNIRICCDCHSFIKHVSNAFNREIIIRDRNRFHHFSKGSCSCRDYW